VTSPDGFAPGPEEAAYRPRSERSIASLLADLANEIRALLRLEVALFRAELAEKLQRIGRGVAALAAGGILAFSGWMALLAAAVLALAMVVRPWLAALIVGIASLAVAALLLYLGKRWLDTRLLVPRRSLNSLREDEAWTRERVP
jgi:hypothetical protein